MSPKRRPRSRDVREGQRHDDDDACPGARAAARLALVGDAGTEIERVHSDTRTPAPGDLFVALQGRALRCARLSRTGACRRRGGRDRRACGLAATRGVDAGPARAPTRWPRCRRSPTAWRARMQLPLIAVTGSNGKTTVTQMIAAILRAWLGDAAFSTQGNFNNHIGVPLTLLRLRQDVPARLAPRRGRRARHEPPGRDRAAGRDRGADGRARQQRAARAPGVHGTASKRWRARTAR